MKLHVGVIAATGLLLTASCTGAKGPSGECLSYACDADGAKAMMWSTVDATYQPSERAKAALDKVIDGGVSRMSRDQDFTPESFELAKGNLKKFLDEVPEAGEDALGPAAEDLAGKTAKSCPLWPYC
ncbi:MAG: hypothetical protein IPG04_04085 [Polyangiaceae bacterium]|nr:hypothetical protein [Polyangiaceae bacterium]